MDFRFHSCLGLFISNNQPVFVALWRPGLMQQPSEIGKWGLAQCFHLITEVGEVAQCVSVRLFVCHVSACSVCVCVHV